MRAPDTLAGRAAALAAAYAVGLFVGWYSLSPRSCDTDSACAATPPCVLTPGCDGGPDPAHQPWAWLP